jgi:hypothetical protein
MALGGRRDALSVGSGCRQKWRSASGVAAQEVPGFLVPGIEAGAAGVAFWGEEEAGAGGDRGDGEDVPGVLGDDVGGQEIHFAGG